MKKLLIIFFTIGVLIFTGWFVGTRYLYSVPILVYHHVDGAVATDSPTVSTAGFSKQMELIHQRGYNVITLDSLVNAAQNKTRLARNSVVITFDDGDKDNYLNAYPVLKKYNFPATIFIITQKVGQNDYISWEEMSEMMKNNISFGAHSRSHFYLPDLNEEGLQYEILGSKKDMEEKLKTEVKYFCYPIGGFSDRIMRVVQEAGYKGAFTTNRGKGRLNENLYALKRVKIGNTDTNPLRMWGKLSGFFNLFRSEKEPY